MFVDASAIIAIIAGEEESDRLSARASLTETCWVSPMVIYEATAGLARKRACPIEESEALVADFVAAIGARVIEITGSIGSDAIKAFRRFGRGRHKADLNMGDCFAYACARSVGAPLLFKGDDFGHTDIEIA